jgi:hypothetical protein
MVLMKLTLDRANNRIDSVTFVYAVGAGGIDVDQARQTRQRLDEQEYYRSAKGFCIYKCRVKTALFNNLDKAYYAWNQINNGVKLPSAPPSARYECNIRSEYNNGKLGIS